MNIEEDVKSAAHGSDKAFERLFRNYYPAVFAAALARLKNYADAEDAAQQTFIEAWRRLPRLRDPARFPGWLRKITVGCCSRISRRPKLLCETMESVDYLESADADPAALAERRESMLSATQSLSKLSKAHRETMILFINGYSHREIASILELPLGTVKRRLHDSRKKLKRWMYDTASDEIKLKTKQAGSTLDRVLRIGEEGSRMNALLKAISSATLDAVNEMYRTCDRIRIADGKINGESVDPVAYAAIVERVKFNAYLLGDAFKPGARSQVLLKFKGRRKDFDIAVTPGNGIVLKLRK